MSDNIAFSLVVEPSISGDTSENETRAKSFDEAVPFFTVACVLKYGRLGLHPSKKV